MQSDRFSMPSAPYLPPRAAEPSRAIAAAQCFGWCLLLAATGVALWAVLFMADSVLSP